MTYLTIKNLDLQPAEVANDGEGRLGLSGMVFTANDRAAIQEVHVDLRLLGKAEKHVLAPDIHRTLPETSEGVYHTHFDVPPLTDPGRYDLPVVARDSEGYTGRRRTTLRVTYRRPDYAASLLHPDNQAVLARVGQSPVTDGNAVTPLHEGDAALAARLELMEGATERIDLETYIFNTEDEVAPLYRALVAKVDAGVEANVIVNSDTQIPAAILGSLRLSFQQILSGLAGLVDDLLNRRQNDASVKLVRTLWHEHKRNMHVVWFGGGLLRERGMVPQGHDDLAPVWLQKMARDAMRARGREPAEDAEEWWHTAFQGPGGLLGLPLLGYALHEKILIVDGARAIVGGRNIAPEYFSPWIDVDLLLAGPVVDRIQQGFIRSFGEFAAADEPANRPTPCETCSDPAGDRAVQFVQSRPWLGEFHTLHTIVTAFQMARRRIWITSQYLVLPDSLLLDALLDAAARGVDIRILTNSAVTGRDLYFATGYFISLNYVGRLLQAGVRVFTLDGDAESEDPQPYLHAKEFLIDGELAAFGSFNLSMRSCWVESENLVNVFAPEIVAAEEERFERRCAEAATEITPDLLRGLLAEHRARVEIARSVELFF